MRAAREIELKIQNPHFHDVVSGKKKCEVRREDDYTYKVGDVLTLCQWHEKRKRFTGKYVRVQITHVLRELAYVQPNHAVLSFELLEVKNALKQERQDACKELSVTVTESAVA